MSHPPFACSCHTPALNRRRLLTLAAFTGGAALLGRARPAFAGKADRKSVV